jgi:hypothetical protein
VSLYYRHPAHFSLSCETCQKFVQKDGVLVRHPARTGPPLERQPGQPTPCATCPKIPEDAPERTRRFARELSPRNLAAFKHYRECAAVGRFPDDPIVRRNAAIIKEVADSYRDSKLDALAALLGGRLAAEAQP